VSEVSFQETHWSGYTYHVQAERLKTMAPSRAVRLSKSRDEEPLPLRTEGQAGSCHREMGHRGLSGTVSPWPPERRLRTRHRRRRAPPFRRSPQGGDARAIADILKGRAPYAQAMVKSALWDATMFSRF